MVARLPVNLPYTLVWNTLEAFTDGLRRELLIYGSEVCAVESGRRARLGFFGSDQYIDGCSLSCEQQFGL